MKRASWCIALGLLLAACGGAPSSELVETDEVAAEESEPSEPSAPVDETPDEVEADDVELDVLPPAAVTAPIGVVYEASGSLNETFGLIQTPDVSVFSTDEVTAYVDAETITVCPVGEQCSRMRRDAIEPMGLLGGQIVVDTMSFASSVPFTSSSTETIAGRDARCVVPEDVEQMQEYCYDLASGIALRWQVIDEDVPTSVTAIEVFEPTAADLAPAGPVEDLPHGAVPGMGFDPGDIDMGDFDMGDFDMGDIDLEDLGLGDLPGS